MVLAGGESGYLQIWDLINVQEVCRITAHEGKTLHKPAMNSDKKMAGKKMRDKAVREDKNSFTFSYQASLLFFVFRALYQFAVRGYRFIGHTNR